MQKNKTAIIEKNYGGVARFFKGLIVSFIITFACIITFAFVIKWLELSDAIISPVNLGIKAVSVAVGALIFTKKSSKGIFKGILFAFVYTLVAFILFSLLAGSITFSFGLILDILFTTIVGIIFGIIGVNTKK